MHNRIEKLLNLTLQGKTYATPIETAFDEKDLLLSRQDMESKRLCEYILNQEPIITPYSMMTGYFSCNESIVGDAFRRKGHKHFDSLIKDYYCKPVDKLSTFEWQHATADYKKILEKGNLITPLQELTNYEVFNNLSQADKERYIIDISKRYNGIKDYILNGKTN